MCSKLASSGERNYYLERSNSGALLIVLALLGANGMIGSRGTGSGASATYTGAVGFCTMFPGSVGAATGGSARVRAWGSGEISIGSGRIGLRVGSTECGV